MVGPKRVISCEDLFQAVDVAFKLFYILNLKFPRETFAVWSFIQIVVYKLTASHVPPSNRTVIGCTKHEVMYFAKKIVRFCKSACFHLKCSQAFCSK